MTGEPTAAEIEAAARAVHRSHCRIDPAECKIPSIEQAKDARTAVNAALPLVEARLREQIAGEIEAVAPPAEPEIGRALYGDDMYGNGMRAAARIARGKR